MASSAPVNKIERGHQMYREGRYTEALGFYTEALSMAKTRPQKIALHSNRAACYLKLHEFKKAAEECTSVLELDFNHTGALMLRAQTLVTLKEYHSALFDVNRLIELNPSSEVYQNLQARLKTQVSLAPIPESEAELEEEEEENEAESCGKKEDVDKENKKEDALVLNVRKDKKPTTEFIIPKKQGVKESSIVDRDKPTTELIIPKKQGVKESPIVDKDKRTEPEKSSSVAGAAALKQVCKESSMKDSKGWQAIPKPKGHSTLDYARWDRVEDDSSGDDDDDKDEEEDYHPQYRFRVKTVGVRPVR